VRLSYCSTAESHIPSGFGPFASWIRSHSLRIRAPANPVCFSRERPGEGTEYYSVPSLGSFPREIYGKKQRAKTARGGAEPKGPTTRIRKTYGVSLRSIPWPFGFGPTLCGFGPSAFRCISRRNGQARGPKFIRSPHLVLPAKHTWGKRGAESTRGGTGFKGPRGRILMVYDCPWAGGYEKHHAKTGPNIIRSHHLVLSAGNIRKTRGTESTGAGTESKGRRDRIRFQSVPAARPEYSQKARDRIGTESGPNIIRALNWRQLREKSPPTTSMPDGPEGPNIIRARHGGPIRAHDLRIRSRNSPPPPMT